MQKLAELQRISRRHFPRIRNWLKVLKVRHINLFFAITFSLIGAVAIAILAAWLLAPRLNIGTQTTAPVDLTKLALTIAAGVGGVVALVVAYRRQRDLEQGGFVEAFGAAAKQLGDADVAVRLAGAYAMAGVADQTSKVKRQQCIDVLCGYLRLPYSPAFGNNHQSALVLKKPAPQATDAVQELQFQYRQNDKVVRQTIVRVIVAHLQEQAPRSWSLNSFDFTGSHFEEPDFSGAVFSGKSNSFKGAIFTGESIRFDKATFNGEVTLFDEATFDGATTRFNEANFNSKSTSFKKVTFNSESTFFTQTSFASSETLFEDANFSGDNTWFNGATFTGECTRFDWATFSGKNTWFEGAVFDANTTRFDKTTFNGETIRFERTTFSGENTWFDQAIFTSKTTSFMEAKFNSRNTRFSKTEFRGRTTWFDQAVFSGETTSFVEANFDSDNTRFNKTNFRGTITRFDKAAFSGETTSFVKTNFGSKEVTFDNPKAWNPAPQFDWDVGNGTEAHKPKNVKPKTWPPNVEQ